MLEAVRDFRDATGRQVGRQARRRHPHLQGRDQVPRHGQRDGRRRLARPRLVPVRRLLAAQRPAAAAPEDDDRRTTPAPTTSRWTDPCTSSTTPPRPSRARSSTSRARTGCSSAASSSTAPARSFKSISPSSEEVLAEVAEATADDIDRAVKAARQAYTSVWSKLPGRERAKYLYRIARIMAERSREFAVLESLDNGKPIKESRDVDMPLVVAVVLLLRRLGRQAVVRRPRARPEAARRRRSDHPVELPDHDAGVEDRAGAGRRQHGRAQARRDHAADRAAVRRGLPAGRPAARRRQHRHRRRRDRAGAGRAPRRRQGRLHRVDRGRQGHRPLGRRHRQEGSRSSSAARPPTSCSTTRRSTRRSRASSAASSSTRVTSAAPARACWCRRTSTTRSSNELKRRMSTLRLGDPLDKNTDIGAINSAEQLARITAARRRRRRRGCRALVRPVRPPGQRVLVRRPRSSPASRQAHRIAREEIFGPVLSVLTFRTPGRGDREGQQHAVRPVRRRVDRQGLAHPVDGRPAARRRRVGQHVQPVRPGLAVRRLQGVRLRPRGRHATASPPTSKGARA